MSDALYAIPPDVQNNVSVRLRRIEGQVRGIQRMVEAGADCRNIINQVAAVKAALTSVSAIVLECYVRDCLNNPECTAEGARDKTIEELIEMVRARDKTVEDLMTLMLKAAR